MRSGTISDETKAALQQVRQTAVSKQLDVDLLVEAQQKAREALLEQQSSDAALLSTTSNMLAQCRAKLKEAQVELFVRSRPCLSFFLSFLSGLCKRGYTKSDQHH